MRSATLAIGLLLPACAYQPGSFTHRDATFAAARATVGCLDVSVAPHEDGEVTGSAAVFTIGNRCDAPVLVDLPVIATARAADGSELGVLPRDPRGEIRPVYLDGRAVAQEYLEYPCPAAAAPVVLCFELGGLDAGAPDPDEIIACIPAACADNPPHQVAQSQEERMRRRRSK